MFRNCMSKEEKKNTKSQVKVLSIKIQENL